MNFGRCLFVVCFLFAGMAQAEGYNSTLTNPMSFQQPGLNHGMPMSFGQQYPQQQMQPYAPMQGYSQYPQSSQYNRCNVYPQQNSYAQGGMQTQPYPSMYQGGYQQQGFAQNQCRRPRRHRHQNGGQCGGGQQYAGGGYQGYQGYQGDGGFSLGISFGSGNVSMY